jgi:hypothetical protein
VLQALKSGTRLGQREKPDECGERRETVWSGRMLIFDSAADLIDNLRGGLEIPLKRRPLWEGRPTARPTFPHLGSETHEQ